jgi:hypothetical protein
MAAKTLTYTVNMAATPKAIHAGLNTLPFNLNSGATKMGTLSDVILLGKVPSGAVITTKEVRLGAASAATHWQLQLLAVEALGTLSVFTTLIDSITGSATAASFRDVQPYKLSLSDDRAVQYAILALNCSTGASETASTSIQGFINYLTDGSSI